MSEDICPRRHTCAMLECPIEWRACTIPNVLNSVSEWLYGDKYVDDSEFMKKCEK